MTQNERVIETRGLTRTFKNVTAVDGLDMHVNRGEIFGLVGPDGAGKTTTIRLLAAILDPTDGWAKVEGFDTVDEPEPIKQRIGYMAQRFNLYGDLSVWENINFFADVFEMRGQERQERIEMLLDFARLDQFRERRARQLSGGMQKKLALACTLIHTPDIIDLDEPTTGVDPVSRREFWDILTDLHLQGITLVVSTPYMDEAERCSRVGMMYRGRLIICDSPDNIKAMIPGHLIALWSSNMRRAKEILSHLEGVLEVQTYGDQLRIFVENVGDIKGHIQTVLAAAGITILEMRRVRPRMEEAFISLISRVDQTGASWSAASAPPDLSEEVYER
jgi:ABC-2 type transport system ATP-binding protein